MLYLFAIVFGFASLGASILISPLAAELFGLSFSIGCAGGPLVAGYIFDITGSYQVVFPICAILSITGIIFGIAY
jgi:cyanate permease